MGRLCLEYRPDFAVSPLGVRVRLENHRRSYDVSEEVESWLGAYHGRILACGSCTNPLRTQGTRRSRIGHTSSCRPTSSSSSRCHDLNTIHPAQDGTTLNPPSSISQHGLLLPPATLSSALHLPFFFLANDVLLQASTPPPSPPPTPSSPPPSSLVLLSSSPPSPLLRKPTLPTSASCTAPSPSRSKSRPTGSSRRAARRRRASWLSMRG